MIERIKQTNELKEQRYTLNEIKQTHLPKAALERTPR
jgi:hypothetical protein